MSPEPLNPDPLLPPPVEPKRPITETRPEILLGAAAAGGFVLAKLLGAVRGR
jgi:hypothetical protein